MAYALAAGIAFCNYTVILSSGAIFAFWLAGFMLPVGGVNPLAFACRAMGVVMVCLASVSLFYAAWGILAGTWKAAWDAYVEQYTRMEERETGIRRDDIS